MRVHSVPHKHYQNHLPPRQMPHPLLRRVLTSQRCSTWRRTLVAKAQDPLSSSEYGIDELPAHTPPAPTPAPSPTPSAGTEQEQKDRNKEAIKQALQQGTLGLGLSAGGFLYCYHLGVLWELARLKVLPAPSSSGALKLAGASAGSLAIATYACGLDVDKATAALLEFAANCRTHGTQGRLGLLLRDFLHAYLPDDAHERCHDQTYVAVTRVFPVWRHEVVHRFHDKDDLVQALVTSCHIPYYANGQWMTKFRGRYYMDGGVAAFIPTPPSPTVVKVCCFPVSDVLDKVRPTVQNYQRVASLLDVSISPDAYEPWPHNYQQLLKWALLPADDDTLKYLINKGRRDALAWATSMDLVSAQEQRLETADSRPASEGLVLGDRPAGQAADRQVVLGSGRKVGVAADEPVTEANQASTPQLIMVDKPTG